MGRKNDPMTTDPDDAIRLIQSGLDILGHAPGTIDGHWGVRTARALRQLIAANGRPASLAPQGPLPWIIEAKTALGVKSQEVVHLKRG
jgi:peptidoglycan hydrolase-like protein with peptidoglycan-binding domain